jgi:hypothetical protein
LLNCILLYYIRNVKVVVVVEVIYSSVLSREV